MSSPLSFKDFCAVTPQPGLGDLINADALKLAAGVIGEDIEDCGEDLNEESSPIYGGKDAEVLSAKAHKSGKIEHHIAAYAAHKKIIRNLERDAKAHHQPQLTAHKKFLNKAGYHLHAFEINHSSGGGTKTSTNHFWGKSPEHAASRGQTIYKKAKLKIHSISHLKEDITHDAGADYKLPMDHSSLRHLGYNSTNHPDEQAFHDKKAGVVILHRIAGPGKGGWSAMKADNLSSTHYAYKKLREELVTEGVTEDTTFDPAIDSITEGKLTTEKIRARWRTRRAQHQFGGHSANYRESVEQHPFKERQIVAKVDLGPSRGWKHSRMLGRSSSEYIHPVHGSVVAHTHKRDKAGYTTHFKIHSIRHANGRIKNSGPDHVHLRSLGRHVKLDPGTQD